MHSVSCPDCGTHVELDFKPVVGPARCPKCDALFSSSETGAKRESEESERNGARDERDSESN